MYFERFTLPLLTFQFTILRVQHNFLYFNHKILHSLLYKSANMTFCLPLPPLAPSNFKNKNWIYSNMNFLLIFSITLNEIYAIITTPLSFITLIINRINNRIPTFDDFPKTTIKITKKYRKYISIQKILTTYKQYPIIKF